MKPVDQVRTQPQKVRRTRRRVSRRAALYTLVIIAPLAWIGLLLFTRFVPPRTTTAFVTVFVLLYVALTSTLAPLAYVISLRFLSSRLYRATVRHALRQGRCWHCGSSSTWHCAPGTAGASLQQS